MALGDHRNLEQKRINSKVINLIHRVFLKAKKIISISATLALSPISSVDTRNLDQNKHRETPNSSSVGTSTNLLQW